MCRCRLTLSNCVSTYMRLKPLLMQLLMGMSMRRYLPAMGTAGLLRSIVRGYRREPRPPPRIRLSTFCMAGGPPRVRLVREDMVAHGAPRGKKEFLTTKTQRAQRERQRK